MIPIRDVIPSRTTPVVTVGLIALNAIAFLFELTLNDQQLHALTMIYGLVSAWFNPVSLVTSMFLHAGWLHFLGNMLYLWIFGDNVEDRMGHGRFGVFYLLCGSAAAFGQMLSDPVSTIPMVGASGAIAGVMGAYLVLFPHSKVLTLVPIFLFIELIEIPAIFFLGIWFLFQVLSGVGSLSGQGGGVAFWAHAAGFLAGIVLVLLFRRPERQRIEWIE